MNWSQIFKAATLEEREQILILLLHWLDPPAPNYSLVGQFRQFPRSIRTAMTHTFAFFLFLAACPLPSEIPFIAVPMLWIVSLTATLTLVTLASGRPPRRPEAHWV